SNRPIAAQLLQRSVSRACAGVPSHVVDHSMTGYLPPAGLALWKTQGRDGWRSSCVCLDTHHLIGVRNQYGTRLPQWMTSRKDLAMSMTPFGQDKFMAVNGLQLHYVEWGTPGNPSLVLLHGFQSNAHTWDTFSHAMADTYHVLALDQRGHGN